MIHTISPEITTLHLDQPLESLIKQQGYDCLPTYKHCQLCLLECTTKLEVPLPAIEPISPW